MLWCARNILERQQLLDCHCTWLGKSLYGLKQAPMQCYRKFDDFIYSMSFFKSDKDHYLYSKDASIETTFLILYVGDMLLSNRHTYWRASWALMVATFEVCNERTRSDSSYPWDEDYTGSNNLKVEPITMRLHLEDFVTFQYNYNQTII